MTYYVHKDAAKDCLSEIKRQGARSRYQKELRLRKKWPQRYCYGLKPHSWKLEADGSVKCFICDWVKNREEEIREEESTKKLGVAILVGIVLFIFFGIVGRCLK